MIKNIKGNAYLNIMKLNMLKLTNLDIPVDKPVEEDIDDCIKNLTLII